MRCRYCGKELALLKRLRGGGEFCSEAHRQSFQDEYNQLALSRLMQANPPAPAASLPDPVSSSQAASPQPNAQPGPRSVPRAPSAVLVAEASVPTPTVKTTNENSAPAEMADFLFEVPDAVMTQTPYVSQIEIEMVAVAAPSLPGRLSTERTSDHSWTTNEQASYQPPIQARNYPTPMSDHPPEAREFGRMAAVVEIGLGSDVQKVPDANLEALEVQIPSYRPNGPGIPWVALPREFAPVFVKLDAFARLDFAPEGAPPSDSVVAVRAAKLEPDQPLQPEPEQALTQVESEGLQVSEPDLAQPVAVETVAVEPVRIEAAFLESVKQLAPKGSVVRPSVQAEVPVSEPPVPEIVTRPLPVTLHGTAASRGKAVQIFTAALPAAAEVQVPPSVALPLRPTMVFGPAPAQKSDVRIDAKPEPKAEARIETKSDPKPEPKKEAKPERTISVRPRKAVSATPKIEAAVVPPPSAAVQKPVDRPVPAPQVDVPTKFDLGLPSLEVQSSGWAKLSAGVKIGLAAGILAVIGGAGYLVTSGGHSKPGPSTPVRQEMTVAAGLPIPDAGWIADWSPDSSHGRRISMLRGSMPLTDYRIEFKAQIESKALGWVFRGMNAKNFYVTKLEVIKPGLEPTVALVHFAVIDGHEEDRVQVPLPIPVRVDTTYQVRFEAVGNRFTTWVQDQKIDEWNDARIISGGAGIYSERGESSTLQGVFNVMQLVAKN